MDFDGVKGQIVLGVEGDAWIAIVQNQRSHELLMLGTTKFHILGFSYHFVTHLIFLKFQIV
jgi:hypothetical protein